MLNKYIGVGLLTGACALGTAWTAEAQTASGDQLAEVVVTGSRVITNGNDSPTPVTVVTVEDIQATRPTTVFEGLSDMPQFAGSRGATTNPGTAGATNNNISSLSLRGVGQGRTLILYDGHRVPPTQQDGYVNANLIPQMLLQRVDIVTGGVSAVYGSDGISGVVNFITDRKFNGVKAEARYGISEMHDDRSTKLGIAGGMDLFGGRGHIEGSYETHDDAGILLRTDRQFGRERWTLQGTGSAATPYFLVPYATISNRAFGGKILGPNSNPLLNQQFVAPGVLGPFQNGSTAGVIGSIQIGGDGAYHTSSSLKAKLNFHQVYGRFDFDVTDNLHYYLTAAGTVENSFVYNTDTSLNGVTLSATNAFLSPTYQQQMTNAGVTTFTLGKMYTLSNGIGPTTGDNWTRQWLVNTGLEGKLGDYRWEAWYTHGLAREDNRQLNAIDNGRLAAALDAVTNNGQIVCRVSVTNPGLYPGCVPMNVFGVGSESPEAIAYVTRKSEYEPKTTMDDVSASITGAPFNDWAGPINMALSGEWRRIEYEMASNSLPTSLDPLVCTGLRFNCTNFNPSTNAGTAKASSSSFPRPPVSQDVAEAAFEADVPLLEGLPLVRSASLNLAYRYARYSQSGTSILTQPNTTRSFDANTWKVGLDWKLTDEVRIRATRSRDFRAPNLADLYAPGNIGNSNLPDFLTGLTPTALNQSGGNPNLEPEVSYTSTVGIVFQPTTQFSLSLDAYDIKIGNAIGNANGASPTAQNACYQSGGSSFYCTLQERAGGVANAIAAYNANPGSVVGNPAYVVTKYYNVPLNLAVQETWGADIEANFRTQLFDHPFSIRTLVAYQPHAIQVLNGVAQQFDYAAVDFSNNNQAGAVWRVSAFARYGVTDHLTVDWQTRWRSALHHNADPTIIIGNGDPDRIPPVAYSNFNLSYRFDRQSWGDANVYFNVQNVFNQQPYPTANAGPQLNPGNFGGYAPGDDPVGRYYSVGVRYKF